MEFGAALGFTLPLRSKGCHVDPYEKFPNTEKGHIFIRPIKMAQETEGASEFSKPWAG